MTAQFRRAGPFMQVDRAIGGRRGARGVGGPGRREGVGVADDVVGGLGAHSACWGGCGQIGGRGIGVDTQVLWTVVEGLGGLRRRAVGSCWILDEAVILVRRATTAGHHAVGAVREC